MLSKIKKHARPYRELTNTEEGPRSDYKRKAIACRIATRLARQYPEKEAWLRNTEKINRELSGRKIYTGHHQVIETTATPVVASLRAKYGRRISSLSVPTSWGDHRSFQSRVRASTNDDAIIELDPYIIQRDCDDSTEEDYQYIEDIDDENVTWEFSIVERSIMDSTVYTTVDSNEEEIECMKNERKSSFPSDDGEEDSTVDMTVDTNEEEVDCIPNERESPFLPGSTGAVAVSSIQQKIIDILDSDLSGDESDAAVVEYAMKELMTYCHPSRSTCNTNVDALTTVVRHGGVLKVLQVMERFPENGYISLMGCVTLEGLLTASSSSSSLPDSAVSERLLRSHLHEMEAVPLLLQIAQDQYDRHVGAYQAARYLISRLYD
jgi:hypothetical protein